MERVSTDGDDQTSSSVSGERGRHYEQGVNKQNDSYVLVLLIAFRIINALSIATFFQPDEYFQSLEPAWKIAFGNQSGAWITWEWQHHMRSSLHPALFAALYFVFDKLTGLLSFLPQSEAMMLVLLPKLFQGLCAATGDYFTWKLAERIHGRGSNTAWTALVLTLLSPWQWFCSTRTLSNSLEMSLTIIALYFWPWQLTRDMTENPAPVSKALTKIVTPNRSPASNIQPRMFQSSANVTRLRLCLIPAGIACILRPTNLLVWASLMTTSITHLGMDSKSYSHSSDLILFIREVILCGGIVLNVSAISDRLYFGMWTFPPYQWLNFNITQSLAVFYGTNNWHYYLSEGLPLLLTTYLPFSILALWSSSSISSNNLPPLVKNIRIDLTFMIFTMIATLSLISHKEVRFIYPLLPSLHILAAPHALSFFNAQSLVSAVKNAPHSPIKINSWRLPLLVLLIITNVAIGVYTTQVHQRGVIDVLAFLRHEYEHLHASDLGQLGARSFNLSSSNTMKGSHDSNETFAAFLMPCHSTPWRSHLIYPNLHAWALTCEPPLHTTPNSPERAAYRDEADRFYDNPQKFLKSELNLPNRQWPRYIVGFEGIETSLKQYLETEKPGWALREKWSGFNSHWHDDGRRVGKVIVWNLVDNTQ